MKPFRMWPKHEGHHRAETEHQQDGDFNLDMEKRKNSVWAHLVVKNLHRTLAIRDIQDTPLPILILKESANRFNKPFNEELWMARLVDLCKNYLKEIEKKNFIKTFHPKKTDKAKKKILTEANLLLEQIQLVFYEFEKKYENEFYKAECAIDDAISKIEYIFDVIEFDYEQKNKNIPAIRPDRTLLMEIAKLYEEYWAVENNTIPDFIKFPFAVKGLGRTHIAGQRYHTGEFLDIVTDVWTTMGIYPVNIDHGEEVMIREENNFANNIRRILLN